jgi:hypothetical protein
MASKESRLGKKGARQVKIADLSLLRGHGRASRGKNLPENGSAYLLLRPLPNELHTDL